MIPLRLLARSAPRSVAQLSTRVASRQLCQFRPAAARVQLPWKQISSTRFAAAFHSSSIRRNDDAALSAKLASELETELAERDPDMVPAAVQSFLDSGLFEIQDVPGKQEVTLTRKYNDETITVTFNIADVNAMEEDLDEPEDGAPFYDEEDQLANDIAGNPKGSVPSSRAPGGSLKVAPEDQLSTTDTDDLGEDQFENEQGFDAHTTIIITRPGKGSLQVEAIAREGELMITSFNHFPSEDIALPMTPEKQLLQSDFYGGPPFTNLDEELQRLLELFIEKRGISNDLALFIPEYIDYKEQKEYLNWLGQIKLFVD